MSYRQDTGVYPSYVAPLSESGYNGSAWFVGVSIHGVLDAAMDDNMAMASSMYRRVLTMLVPMLCTIVKRSTVQPYTVLMFFVLTV